MSAAASPSAGGPAAGPSAAPAVPQLQHEGPESVSWDLPSDIVSSIANLLTQEVCPFWDESDLARVAAACGCASKSSFTSGVADALWAFLSPRFGEDPGVTADSSVSELKAVLKSWGRSISGKKSELWSRIQDEIVPDTPAGGAAASTSTSAAAAAAAAGSKRGRAEAKAKAAAGKGKKKAAGRPAKRPKTKNAKRKAKADESDEESDSDECHTSDEGEGEEEEGDTGNQLEQEDDAAAPGACRIARGVKRRIRELQAMRVSKSKAKDVYGVRHTYLAPLPVRVVFQPSFGPINTYAVRDVKPIALRIHKSYAGYLKSQARSQEWMDNYTSNQEDRRARVTEVLKARGLDEETAQRAARRIWGHPFMSYSSGEAPSEEFLRKGTEEAANEAHTAEFHCARTNFPQHVVVLRANHVYTKSSKYKQEGALGKRACALALSDWVAGRSLEDVTTDPRLPQHMRRDAEAAWHARRAAAAATAGAAGAAGGSGGGTGAGVAGVDLHALAVAREAIAAALVPGGGVA